MKYVSRSRSARAGRQFYARAQAVRAVFCVVKNRFCLTVDMSQLQLMRLHTSIDWTVDKFELKERKSKGSGSAQFDLRETVPNRPIRRSRDAQERPRRATNQISTTGCENAAAAHS